MQDNGFIEVSHNVSHKKMFRAETNTTVIVPVHSEELKKGIEKAILKQAGLKNS